jgi:hypothetical protein
MAAALAIGMRRAQPRSVDPDTAIRPSSGHPLRPQWAPGARAVCWGVPAGPGVVSCELGVTYGCQRLGWDCEYRESKYCPTDAGAPGTR